jgi:CheY-like chemotaxis protein
VNRLITGMSELSRRALGERIAIETVLAGGLWKTNVDANQLESAILNLAVNARDAMPDGGKLTLETGNAYLDDAYALAHTEVKPGQYVMIAVSDTGTGMTDEVLQRAFEPFYTTKGEGRGTGLGLSQVFGFVKQSGGHIKLYSEPNQGVTVKIYLPRQMAEGAPEAATDLAYVEVPLGTEAVLVVEDHERVRDYVANALRHLGYHVLEAADGLQALDVLSDHPEIALLLTDVVLPGRNGRQLAEQARQRNAALKVVFMTGYAPNAISHNGLLDIGVHLLPKPFTMQQLARKLRNAFAAR